MRAFCTSLSYTSAGLCRGWKRVLDETASARFQTPMVSSPEERGMEYRRLAAVPRWIFLGALIYFVLVKGPQEHVRVDEDGQMHLVTADGEPIEWNKPSLRATDDDGEDDDGEDDDGAGKTGGSGSDLGSHGASRAKK